MCHSLQRRISEKRRMAVLVSQSLPFQVRQAYVARLAGNGSKSFLGYRWNDE